MIPSITASLPPNPATVALKTTPPHPLPTLAEAAGQFLEEMTPVVKKHYLELLKYSLRELVAQFGTVVIDKVTFAMILQALAAMGVGPRTTNTAKRAIQSLFNWSTMKGYLPRGVRTAADLTHIPMKFEPLPIIAPGSLQRLLYCADDVELQVAIALWSFAGIDYDGVMRLDWSGFQPGQSFYLKPGPGAEFGLGLALRPVLDDWVSPFYGCKGPVIASKDLRRRLRLLTRRLRITVTPGMLRRSHRVYSLVVARHSKEPDANLNLDGYILQGQRGRSPTIADAEEFFSRTPARIGISNWPEIVASFKHED